MRREAWGKVMKHDFGWLIPIFALVHENDPDPKMRTYRKPDGKKLREKLIVGATAGLKVLYEHRLQRETQSSRAA